MPILLIIKKKKKKEKKKPILLVCFSSILEIVTISQHSNRDLTTYGGSGLLKHYAKPQRNKKKGNRLGKNKCCIYNIYRLDLK